MSFFPSGHTNIDLFIILPTIITFVLLTNEVICLSQSRLAAGIAIFIKKLGIKWSVPRTYGTQIILHPRYFMTYLSQPW